MDAILIFLGSGCLVCLMPLALYLLYLAHLNHRTPPALVPGPWDFAAVLLGLSGFLILAGPLLLTVLNSAWRSYAFGGWADLKAVGRTEAMAGSFMAAGYLLLLGVGTTILIRRRRPVTAVYNVAPESVEPAIVGLLDELGYPWRRADGRIEIGLRKSTEPPGPQDRHDPHETASVRVEPFSTAAHATIRWDGSWEAVRSDVEAVLPRSLAAPARNPMAGWMYTAAVAVMVAMLLWLAVLIFLVVTPPPG